MSINFGSNKISKVYVGGTAIGKVYKGSELVYQSGPKYYCYHGDKTPYSYFYTKSLIPGAGTYELYHCSDYSTAANSSADLVGYDSTYISYIDGTGFIITVDIVFFGPVDLHWTRVPQNDLYR